MASSGAFLAEDPGGREADAVSLATPVMRATLPSTLPLRSMVTAPYRLDGLMSMVCPGRARRHGGRAVGDLVKVALTDADESNGIVEVAGDDGTEGKQRLAARRRRVGLLGISANTVRRWTDAGQAARASQSGRPPWRYRPRTCAPAAPRPGRRGGRGGETGTDELTTTVDACLELARLMTEAPREFPRELAGACRLTGAARSDIYTLADGSLQLIAAMEGDQPETSRTGQQWRAEDWSPVALSGVLPGAGFFSAADPAAEPRAREALRRRGCRSLLWAPMCAGAQVVGAVEISDAGLLDLSRHLPVVAAFANLCAQALGLESTYEQLARRERAMQELIDLSHEIAGTLDIEGFVLNLAHRLMAAVHADDVDVWRVKDGRVTCLVSLNRDGVDPSQNGSVMHLDTYPGTSAALSRLEPFIVNDLREPTLTEAEVAEYHRWGYVSSLTMPLVAGGRLVGIVELYDDAERDWRVHIPFLTGVLQPVAGLFDNAVLLREVEQYSRFQQALVDLSASLARAGSLEEVAVDTATRLRALSAAEDCDVWWLEEGYLRCLASVDSNGLDEAVRGKTLRLDLYPSTAEALERREPLVLASAADPRLTDYEREHWSAHGFNSVISLPLVNNDETLGMIDIFDRRERDYDDVYEVLLSAGGAVAAALKSAFLVENLRQSNSALRELVELTDEVGETNGMDELARIVARRLRDILQAEDCDIWVIDGSRMRCLASFDSNGWDENEEGSERDLAAYADTVAALAANEPMVVGDLESAPLSPEERRSYLDHWGYRSMVSLPLVAEGEPVGLIDIFDTRVRDYTGRLDFIRSVARLLASAFEKARLLERLAAGNSELRILVESGMEFGSSLDVAAVLRAVAQRILEVSGADMCDVCSLDGEEAEVLVSLRSDGQEVPVGQRYPLPDFATFREARASRRPVVVLDVLLTRAWATRSGTRPCAGATAPPWTYRCSPRARSAASCRSTTSAHGRSCVRTSSWASHRWPARRW